MCLYVCIVWCVVCVCHLELINSLNWVSLLAGIVEALVDAANDKDESTQVALCKAIVDIGIKKHASVIKICLNYLTKYTKVSIN